MSSDAYQPDASQPDASQPPAPLTCGSHTFCSDYSAAKYYGQTLPAMSGGTIADGLYRLAYLLSTDADDGDGHTVANSGYAIYGLMISHGQFLNLGLGEVGTFSTTNATFTEIGGVGCDSEVGATEDAADPHSYPYAVDGSGHLYLFIAGLAHVLVPVQSLCGNLPSTVPTTPGDSANCSTLNCYCNESTSGAPSSCQ